MKPRKEAAPISPQQAREAYAILEQVKRGLLLVDPSIADDEKLFIDMLDGESDALDTLRAAMRASLEAEAYAEGIEGRADMLTERKARFRRRAEMLKSAVFQAMLQIGIKNLDDPEFSMRVQQGKPRVIITEVEKLPADCVEITHTPKKREIGAKLNAGEDVPGAILSNAEPFPVVKSS